MEEKERFELFGKHCIKDNNPDARCQLLDAYVACVILNEQDKENQQLKKQLAEKDEEIAYLTKQVKKFNNEAQKYFEDAYCNDFHNQDKISFAIEQLEKVKEFVSRQLFITTKDSSDLDEAEAKGCNELREETIKEIDNQINELKGE